MRGARLVAAGTLAAALTAVAAAADEAEILAHYDAYEAAMQQLRYDVAETEAEAAWRAAEDEWGGVEDTGVLAFNLVRLRLMADRRDDAVEPAARLKELVDSGAVTSVTPAEAELFATLAAFDGATENRREIRALKSALDGFEASDYITRRIAWLGWGYVANAYALREQWRDATAAAETATALLAQDETAPLAMRSTMAIIQARGGYETDDIEDGLAAARRGIAAYPPQPAGAPIDPSLTTLLVWGQGLSQLSSPPVGGAMPDAITTFADLPWDDERYPLADGCRVEWADQPLPPPRFGGPPPTGIGAVLEFTLAPDGAVASVEAVGDRAGDEVAFIETLQSWRAAPPDRPECAGPYPFISVFLFPREGSSR